jgi:hypothetical protein
MWSLNHRVFSRYLLLYWLNHCVLDFSSSISCFSLLCFSFGCWSGTDVRVRAPARSSHVTVARKNSVWALTALLSTIHLKIQWLSMHLLHGTKILRFAPYILGVIFSCFSHSFFIMNFTFLILSVSTSFPLSFSIFHLCFIFLHSLPSVCLVWKKNHRVFFSVVKMLLSSSGFTFFFFSVLIAQKIVSHFRRIYHYLLHLYCSTTLTSFSWLLPPTNCLHPDLHWSYHFEHQDSMYGRMHE